MIIIILLIAFIIGIGEGYYIHETLDDHEIRVEANKLISERTCLPHPIQNLNISIGESNVLNK